MKTTIQELQLLREDLNRLHGETFDKRITNIINLVKVIKPESKIKATPVKAKSNNVILKIEEGNSVYELEYPNEAQAEKFLKAKQKERVSLIKSFLTAKSMIFPTMRNFGGTYAERLEAFQNDKEQYSETLKDAGFNFSVQIITNYERK
jgi:hypothetical protein